MGNKALEKALESVPNKKEPFDSFNCKSLL